MKKPFFKAAYEQEWKTIPIYLFTCIWAIGIPTLTGYLAKPVLKMTSDAAISTLLSILDLGIFWLIFISLLVRKDFKSVRPVTGRMIKEKVFEYALLATWVEAVYFIIRWLLQYVFQRKGYNPGAVNLIIQLSAMTFFTIFLPPIKHGLKILSQQAFKKRH